MKGAGLARAEGHYGRKGEKSVWRAAPVCYHRRMLDAALKIIIPLSVVVIAIWLLWLAWWEPLQRRRQARGELVARGRGGPRARLCPICNEPMGQGERVKTRVYPGKGEKIAHIYGCPSCYPPNAACKRICPVCQKEVPRDGYLIARMFERQHGQHVHVLGCTHCRRG